jgi:hypothetical protein
MYNKGLIKNGKKRTMLAALFLCWLFNTALVSELAELTGLPEMVKK